ncbi:MAG: hypothetical protein ACLVEL_05200 [Ruthenibacterium sp.]
MKKRWLLMAPACILVLFTAAALLLAVGRRPYKNLDAAQIASAKVRLSPPDKTVEIENASELAGCLNDVVIYYQDNSYTEYAGQAAVFTLTMTDGTQTEIAAYSPFLIIDGVGYKTKQEPCEALSRYADELLRSGTAGIILEEPPALSVISGGTSVSAFLGTYSWQKKDADGNSVSINAGSAHPLHCEELLSPPYETPDATAALRFAEEPDAVVSVKCWSDEYWGEPAACSEEAAFDGGALALKAGAYIYEITAVWNAENGYGGTASYFFYIKMTE